MAMDVAITCPLAPHQLRVEEPCESYAENHKHKKYDEGFVGSAFDYCPIIFETLGAVNVEGERMLKKLFRNASSQLNITHSVYAGRAWARFSCVIQRMTATMILRRTAVSIDAAF